jgi:hypothetical protein
MDSGSREAWSKVDDGYTLVKHFSILRFGECPKDSAAKIISSLD